MNIKKIKVIEELKRNFKIMDYYQIKMNSNVDYTIGILEEQKKELSDFINNKNLFYISKNKIKFFNIEITIKESLLKIENTFSEETHLINTDKSLTIDKNNKNIIIKNKDIEVFLKNIKHNIHDIEIEGNKFKTIEDGIYLILIPIEKHLYDLLYRIIKGIIEYNILKEKYYTL